MRGERPEATNGIGFATALLFVIHAGRLTLDRISAVPRTARKTVTGDLMNIADPLLEPLREGEHRDIAGVRLDIVRTGACRVKRVIYPPGFRWSIDMKPIVGSELCMHAHVGFLARGQVHIQYADGCVLEFVAPQVVAIEPGHDGWVVGDEPAVLVEFDFERETVNRLGMPEAHHHR